MNELYHHGVKGQKWGVRRYQNKDGSLTSEGLKRYRTRKASKTNADVKDIVDTFSKEDKDKLGLTKTNDYIESIDQGEWIGKRILKKIGDKPVAFFDLEQYDDGQGNPVPSYNAIVGVRNDPGSRGKGYGYEVAKKGMDWVKKHPEIERVWWGVRKDNIASNKIAQKLGFKQKKSSDPETKIRS